MSRTKIKVRNVPEAVLNPGILKVSYRESCRSFSIWQLLFGAQLGPSTLSENQDLINPVSSSINYLFKFVILGQSNQSRVREFFSLAPNP